MLRHSAATGVATGKIGSKQRQRPIQKHAGKSSIDRKTAPHLSERRNLLICDAHNCERVVKTFQTSLRKNKELRTASDFSPSMLLHGTQSLFRTNFPRCHALLGFLTSSLASPMSRDEKNGVTKVDGLSVRSTKEWYFSGLCTNWIIYPLLASSPGQEVKRLGTFLWIPKIQHSRLESL